MMYCNGVFNVCYELWIHRVDRYSIFMKSYQNIGRVKQLHCKVTLLQMSNFVISPFHYYQSAFEGATVFYFGLQASFCFFLYSRLAFVTLWTPGSNLECWNLCWLYLFIVEHSARHFSGRWRNSLIFDLSAAPGFFFFLTTMFSGSALCFYPCVIYCHA